MNEKFEKRYLSIFVNTSTSLILGLVFFIEGTDTFYTIQIQDTYGYKLFFHIFKKYYPNVIIVQKRQVFISELIKKIFQDIEVLVVQENSCDPKFIERIVTKYNILDNEIYVHQSLSNLILQLNDLYKKRTIKPIEHDRLILSKSSYYDLNLFRMKCKTEKSLFCFVNMTITEMGQLLLKQNFQYPFTNIDKIHSRHSLIKKLQKNIKSYDILKSYILKYPDMSILIKKFINNLDYKTIFASSVKTKHTFQIFNILKLTKKINKDEGLECFIPESINKIIKSNDYNALLLKYLELMEIDEGLDKDKMWGNDFKYIYVFKRGLNSFLDVARIICEENYNDLHEEKGIIEKIFGIPIGLKYESNIGHFMYVDLEKWEECVNKLSKLKEDNSFKNHKIFNSSEEIIDNIDYFIDQISNEYTPESSDISFTDDLFSLTNKNETKNIDINLNSKIEKSDYQANFFDKINYFKPNIHRKKKYNISNISLIDNETTREDICMKSEDDKMTYTPISSSKHMKNISIFSNINEDDEIKEDECEETFNIPSILKICEKRGKIYFTTKVFASISLKLFEAYKQIMQLQEKYADDLLQLTVPFLYIFVEIYGFISELDVILSFYDFQEKEKCVVPEFANFIHIDEGCNLLVAPKSRIKNNIICLPDLNINILTGENMSGKTTYLKQIAHFTILAQIGCLVPAKKAICKIFTRISSYASNKKINLNVNEMKDSEAHQELTTLLEIINTADENSLMVFDELAKTMNYHEGICFSIATLKTLIYKKSFVYFSTHFPQILCLMNGQKGVNAIMCKNFNINSGILDKSNGIELCKRYFPHKIIEDALLIMKKYSKDYNRANYNNAPIQIALRIVECKTEEEKIEFMKKIKDNYYK